MGLNAPVEMPLGALMVDVGGEELTAAEADFLRHPAVGAVILFARNCRDKAQVRALAGAIKALRAPPLLVAVDQEGGRVQRLKRGFHQLPAAARFGEVYDRAPARALALAEVAGRLLAAEVRAAGIDFSFAPVLDCGGGASRVIGDRAFHRAPTAVCALAGACIAGMNRAGMAATGKHFPGHGGVAADSHDETPVDARALAEVEARDLAPFAALAPRLGGVMTAHILFRNIHPQPPTFSAFWLHEILRQKLNFGGVIFSDDLSMKGAAGGDAAAALKAGCDMALLCNDPAAARRTADALGENHAPNQARLLAMRGQGAIPAPAVIARLAAELAAAGL